MKNYNMMYRDQAVYHTHYGDRCFYAAYTPEGIRQKESGYIKRILNFQGSEKDRMDLKKEIENDLHLHKIIRNNLINNLDNR